MVTLLVAATFIVAILGHLLYQRMQGAQVAHAVKLGARTFPEAPGTPYLTRNHLRAELAASERIRLGPDEFLHKALGPDAHLKMPKAGAQIEAGAALFTAERGEDLIEISAPFEGVVEEVDKETVVLRPHRFGRALRRMIMENEIPSYWNRERKRMEVFLGEMSWLQNAAADGGGELADGWLWSLTPSERCWFRRRFLKEEAE